MHALRYKRISCLVERLMPTVEEMDNEKLPRGIEIYDHGDTLYFYGNHSCPTTIEGTSLWYVAVTDWNIQPVTSSAS